MTTAPDRHARRREATRAKLVEAAKALFARQGVDNTRIQEITDEADVGFGSFYNHFQSKEALIEVVLADTIAEGVLRLFGLPADEAAQVARRPLPATS
jgi:AcrR family transcriptional regulator